MNSRGGQCARMIGRDAERAGIVLSVVVIDAVDDEQRLRWRAAVVFGHPAAVLVLAALAVLARRRT